MRKTLLNITKGNFKVAFDELLQSKDQLSSETAVAVIEACCKGCKEKLDDSENQALISIIITCTKATKDIDGPLKKRYIVAMYYIFEYLMERSHYDIIVKIESTVLCNLVPDTSEPQNNLKNITSISACIYSKMLHDANKCRDDICSKISIFSLKLLAFVGRTDDYLKRVQNFLQLFSCCNISSNVIRDFYMQAMQVLYNMKMPDNVSKMATFKIVINIIRHLTQIFGKTDSLHTLQELIEISLKNSDNIFAEKWQKDIAFTISAFGMLLKVLEKYEKITFLSALTTAQENLANIEIPSDSKSTEDLISAFNIISVTLELTNFHYFKSISSKLWSEIMTKDVQLLIFTIFKKITSMTENVKTKCDCSSECITKTYLARCVKYTSIISVFCEISLSQNTEFFKCETKTVYQYLSKGLNYIHTLKKNNCSHWNDSTDLLARIYMIAVKLYKAENFDCLMFFNMLIYAKSYMGNIENPNIKFDIFDTSLMCTTEFFIKQKNFNKALYYSAFRIATMSDENTNTAFSQWIKVKSQTSEDETLKSITVPTTIKKNAESIKKLCPDFVLDDDTVVHLLQLELQNYKKCYPSKVAMLSAFKELHALVDAKTSARTFAETWGVFKKSVQDELVCVLDDLSAALTKSDILNKDADQDFILGVLDYCHYKYKRNQIIEKTRTEVESIGDVIKPAMPTPDGVFHENTECDIVTMYENLNYKCYLELEKYLSQAVDHFNSYLCKYDLDPRREQHSKDVLDILVMIGNEYRLHSVVHKFIQAWTLVLKTAHLLQNNPIVLKSLSFIYEKIKVNTDAAEELLNVAQETIIKLANNKSPEKFEAVVTFYISKSFALIRYGKMKKAYEDFQRAQMHYQELLSLHKENLLLKSRLLYLEYEFLKLPCKYKIMEHDVVFAVRLRKACHDIIDYFKQDDSSAFCISIMYDITTALVDMYYWMRLPREMRCYGKELIVLAQKLVIPYRTAKLLVYLAQADFLSLRLDDCKVKLDGIASVLNISKQEKVPVHKSELKKPEINTVVDTLEEEFREMTLDMPVSQKITEPGSPVLKQQSFRLPEFLKHDIECGCFACTCTAYQELFLNKVHLDALLSEHTATFKETNLYFSAALHMHENFILRGQKPRKSLEELLIPNLSLFIDYHSILESPVFVLNTTFNCICLAYGNALLRQGNTKKAEEINKKILSEINKHQNIWLYNEAVLQQIYFMPIVSCIANEDVTSDCEEVSPVTPTKIKTPESKTTRVRFQRCLTPEHISPIKKPLQKIPFELPEDDENDNKLPVNTPAKIKIYTPAAPKTKRKTKAKQSEIVERKPCTENINIALVSPPSSPVKSTPAPNKSAGIENCLRSKSKLLTSRIKQSVQNIPEIVITDEGCSSAAAKSVRKNLLNELSEPTSSQRNGMNTRSGVMRTTRSSRSTKN